jgi:hypothetical protein
LNLNGTHQFLVYADLNIIGRSRHTRKKNKEALVVASKEIIGRGPPRAVAPLERESKEIRLEVNADKTKYMVMSRDQNAGQSHNMKTDNSSFERDEQFKHLGKI